MKKENNEAIEYLKQHEKEKYAKYDDLCKSLLKGVYGTEDFISVPVMDRINKLEDAVQVRGNYHFNTMFSKDGDSDLNIDALCYIMLFDMEEQYLEEQGAYWRQRF